ncbi:ArdC family protein [Dyadobacter sp. CY323]|uniref:ArdC family protein n=1 Tax=Dyadobacter sp. CY323 TaxID=2907302 RepID=UPI001EEBB88F|nr:zincin-like metallopeptidase domain-containing protein [Dyadobacter sp. CY323]MCE6993112.1 ssDNA-binding domain-containing protein [Dyadobacter sp. CY323]
MSQDLHTQITAKIIAQLEQGAAPWHKPWQEGEHNVSFELPVNVASGKRYRGINIPLLWMGEFPTNEFGTFKQWSERKEVIRKGSKGTTVVYYDFIEKQKEGKEEIDKIPFLKTYTVFNRSQLQSYKEVEPLPRPTVTFETIKHIDDFIDNTGAQVTFGGTVAYYSGRTDEIKMPDRNLFTGTPTQTITESIYATLAHELTHWTGPEKRLGRDMGKRFGDKKYAGEEIVAEMGSAFLSADWGIADAPRPDHAQYIGHWLQLLTDNKKAIFQASSEASKAFEYLHTLQLKA